MNSLSNLGEYSISPTDDLILESEVKVTAGHRGGKGATSHFGLEVHLLVICNIEMKFVDSRMEVSNQCCVCFQQLAQ